jgi:hypothetical protein
MSLSELITTKASAGTHTQSVKNGVIGSNRAFLESDLSSKQASFKDLILAAETIESTVENTLHDQSQESEDAHNQMDGDKIVANLTHFTNEPIVDDAKSAKEQENSDHNGAGSEPLATDQVATQEDVQLLEPREVSPKVVVETTGYVQVGNQKKTAIPTQNKKQDLTQIQGHSQPQLSLSLILKLQGQAIITNTATELAGDLKQGVDSEQAVDPRQILSQSVKGVHLETPTVEETQSEVQAKKSIQPKPSERTQATSQTQTSYYSSESQQGNITTTRKTQMHCSIRQFIRCLVNHSLIKDNSLGSLNVMGSSGSLVLLVI